MYQAKPFAVMPSTGSHEQAVSGRQAAAAAAADMGLPILAKSFSSLIRSLKLTPPFQSISFFLFLSLSLCCGRPPSCRTTHTHTHTHIYYTHTHALLPPHCLFSLSLFSHLHNGCIHECRWTLWKRAASRWAIPGLVDFTVVWYSSSCQAWP